MTDSYEGHESEEAGSKAFGRRSFLAGMAGAEADKLFETKGLDFIDREKAKHQAKKEAERLYDQDYAN